MMGANERCDVTEDELNVAVARKLKNLPQIKSPGESFLQTLRTVKRNLAHTNEAARAARNRFLTMTHYYGCPKLLFTISFDDALDIRILALSGKTDCLDWLNTLAGQSPSEVASALEETNAIRMKYPGLCALTFEMLFGIILDKVVGANEKKVGVFGELDAYAAAVEEQGRKTLHAHIIVYIDGWNGVLHMLQSEQKRTRKDGEKLVVQFMDNALSTALDYTQEDTLLCPRCKGSNLLFAGHQGLRDARHKLGSRHSKLAKCDHCEIEFTGDKLAIERTLPTNLSCLPCKESKALVSLEILNSTRPDAPLIPIPAAVKNVNYRYNNHSSCHAKTCFKKGLECRANLPDLPERKSKVLYSDDPYDLYDWRGRQTPIWNVTARPKRKPEDAYVNSHSIVVSKSKAPANSNISVTTGCRSAIYTSCYTAKATQKEDTDELKRVVAYVGSRFSDQRNENTLFEGLSRLMGAVIVGTGEHVVSAPMASYLVRNGSRFKFSQDFQYVPLREITELLLRDDYIDKIKMTVKHHEKGCFLTNQALHYLHRPPEMEEVSMLKFFENYEIRRTFGTDNGHSETVYKINNPNNPGYQRQLIKKRKEPVLAQFSHWSFPDTSSFGIDIMDLSLTQCNSSVESYCRSVLILFIPFRTKDDLTVEGSFWKGFKRRFHNGVKPHIRNFLNNIQLFYNSMRMPALDDPLRDMTDAYQSPFPAEHENESEDDEDEEYFDGMLGVLAHQSKPPRQSNHTGDLSFTALRRAGARNCGFLNMPSLMDVNTPFPSSEPFLAYELDDTNRKRKRDQDHDSIASRDKVSRQHLMELTYTCNRRVLRPPTKSRDNGPPLVEADGTVLSILKWSKQPHLNMDREQQLAFQIVTASYVLTYYRDAETFDPTQSIEARSFSHNRSPQTRRDFLQEKKKLLQLSRLKNSSPLRMFLDGPGGSGKSRIVKEVLNYAKDYTNRLNVSFDMRNIVVTAMSGVAAVSIGGETLHSAAAFNRKIACDDTSWANVRLLVVDEVSFMSSKDVDTMDDKLRKLTRNHDAIYGGLNVLFCGDFMQLEPVRGSPLYSRRSEDRFWSNSINCYIELKGLHRYKDDQEWGRILSRLRKNCHSVADIDKINERTIKADGREDLQIPQNSSYCVYSNNDRSAINTGIFYELLKARDTYSALPVDNMIVIKASDIKIRKPGKRDLSMNNHDKEYVFENCADNKVTTNSGGSRGKGHFVDPLLKLYYGVPMMLLTNEDVPNGHANGTRVVLKQVVLHDDAVPKVEAFDGTNCRCVHADDVMHLLCETTSGKLFKIKPKRMTCSLKVPVPAESAPKENSFLKFSTRLTQLPLIANSATTGHKLQGQTKDNLVIAVWSGRKNWNYVALSRVTTREGLYLVSTLPYDADFSIAPDLIAMLDSFRSHSPEELNWNIQIEEQILENRRKTASYRRKYRRY